MTFSGEPMNRFTCLFCNFLSLERQHFLLLIGVIGYSLATNQQLALHGLQTKKQLIIDPGLCSLIFQT